MSEHAKTHDVTKTRFFKVTLGFFVITLYPVCFIVQLFFNPEERGYLWRLMASWLVRTTFKIHGLKLHVQGRNNIPLSESVVYTSNHPTEMDGFVLLSLLGPNTILFTAPFHQFNSLLGMWLRKMEAIDVSRDPIDDVRYYGTNTKREALALAVKRLKQGKSIIIFPEGHIEILRMHHFHTGAARMSLAAGVSVIPVALHNSDQIFKRTGEIMSSTIMLSIGEKIPAQQAFGTDILFTLDQEKRDIVVEQTRKIEAGVKKMLPRRLLDLALSDAGSNVGVFVDIDMTLYHGLSQKDLVIYLFEQGKIKRTEAFRVFWWLMIQKMGMITHDQLMQKALGLLKDWDTRSMERMAHSFFVKKALVKMHYDLFSILLDHLEKEHTIVIVSEVIDPLAKEFGNFFKAKGVLDTYMKKRDKRYTGEIKFLCYGGEKARQVKQFAEEMKIDLSKSYAYADHESDIPFLKLARYPVVVNPNPGLMQYAKENNFRILNNID